MSQPSQSRIDESPLTHQERATLLRYGRIQTLEKGEMAIAPDAPMEGFYLVLRGQILLTAARKAASGQVRVVLVAGHVFGQAVPGETGPSPFGARALEAAMVIHFDSAALSLLMHDHLRLGARLLMRLQLEQTEFQDGLQESRSLGRLIAVYGPKGGAGSTASAIALAGLAAEHGVEALLVDLHPYFGEVATLCEWRPEHDLADLLSEPVTEERLREAASTGRAYDILAAPRRVEAGETIEAAGVRELLEEAVRSYELTIVDLPELISPLVLESLELADKVVLVSTADLEGLLNIRKVRALLARLEIPEDQVEIVLNRYRGAGGLTPDQLHQVLGRTASVVAEDSGQLLRLANEGRLWGMHSEVPCHPLVRSLEHLLRRFLDLAASSGGPPPLLYEEPRALLPASGPESPHAEHHPHSAPPRLAVALASPLTFLLSLLGLT